jgi:hypothetical protein
MMSKEISQSQPVTVGGPVLAASATLRVFGPTLDPDEITRMLQQAPTSFYRAGDQVSPRIIAKRKTGMWRLDSSLPRTDELSAHVTLLLARLPDDRTIWEELNRTYTADVYCAVDIRVPNSGTELTKSAISALAMRGLTVQFDFYAFVDEEGESVTR